MWPVKVPSHQSPAQPSLKAQSVPADKLFAPQSSKPETYQRRLTDTYYRPISEASLLSEVVTTNKTRYRQLVDEAVSLGKLTASEGEQRKKNFDAGKLGPYTPPTNLKVLAQVENEQFCLLRHSQQCADGLYRTQDYYVPAGALQISALAQGWETSPDKDGQDIPVADTVVVGAGPGGLTTAWQTARRGGRVVCFEAELAGSAFSDAGAKAVHSMRTSIDGTNLIQDGHALATLEHPMSLHGHLADFRNLARAGQKAEEKLTGIKNHGVAPESQHPQDRNAPAARGELFEHLARLSNSLASDFPNAFLCERSPVNEITFENGLFTVQTSRGHKVKAKSLVLATGLTGPQGQKARLLPMFEQLSEDHPMRVLNLGQEGDVSTHSERLTEIAQGDKQALVVHDRLLGHQAVRQTVAKLDEGSRAAVVGSGESAIKAALELLHLNPGLSVDLFAKDTIEAAQTQLPNENFHTAVLENTLSEPQAVKAAEQRAEVFGTPVTPRSLLEIMEMQQAGRLRLLEMGAYFDPKSVSMKAQGDGSIQVTIEDKDVRDSLATRQEDFQSKGLAPNQKAFSRDNYQVMVQAVGYKKEKLSEHPLRHLPPEAHQKMHFNTAGQPYHPAETSLAGLSVRGRQLAEHLSEHHIPEDRRIEHTVPQERGIDWREVDKETVAGIIEHRGVHPGFARSVQREIDEFGSHPQALQVTLPSSDEFMRELYRKKESGQISAAELEVLQRGLALNKRMTELKS